MATVCLMAASCGGTHVDRLVFAVARVEEAPATFAGSARPVLDAARAYAPPGGERAAPVSLTASDGTGLELVELDARAQVVGPLAFTELHLTFANPEQRTLEGRFALTLPCGATVTRLALSTDGDWHEAEVAPRARGRAAYPAGQPRRVDPVLAELAPDGRLLARVFPIPAGGSKQLVVSYVHELRARGAPYRLPLAGLPVVERLRVSVAVGDQVVRMASDGKAPVADFETATAGTGLPDGLRAGRLAVVRIAPAVGGAREPMPALTILYDTSASRVWRFRRDVDRLDALVQALRERFGGDLPLRVVAFDQSVETIFDGHAGGWDARSVDRLLLRRPLGASNLGGALAYVAGSRRRERLLLWSDLVVTAGASEPEQLAAALAGADNFERVDVVVADGGHEGEALARRLVAGLRERDGVVMHAEASPREISARLALRAVSGVTVTVAGARWVHPARLDGLQDGDETLVYAELDAPGAAAAARAPLAFELTGTLGARYDVALADAPAPLLEAAHAGARIGELEGRGDGARAEIVELSTRAHVLARQSAFVVLDNDTDYERLGIARRAPGELLVVGKSGLRVVPRRVAPLPVQKPLLSARRDGQASVGGVVIERATGAPLADVTVVATSPSLVGSVAELTDVRGRYRLEHLPAGDYQVEFYFGDQRQQQRVRLHDDDEARVDAGLDTRKSAALDPAGPATASPAPTAASVVDRGVDGLDGSAAQPGALAQADELGDGPVIEPDVEAQNADDALAAILARHAARPDDPVVLRRLGEALTRRGKVALAARVYGSLVDLYPGRADMLRVAGQWLEPLGPSGADLALDAYARALADRPDHASAYRMAAFALARRGRLAEAFSLLARALRTRWPAGRFAGFAEVTRQDLGVLAAAWAAAEPERRDEIRQRAATLGASLEEAPSLRIVLTWETDASDVDLHVFDAEGHEASARCPTLPDYGGTLIADVASGYGPEAFVIDSPDAFPYHIEAHVQDRGATGLVLGRVQILRHDGRGTLRYEDRPFAAAAGQAIVDLGRIDAGGGH